MKKEIRKSKINSGVIQANKKTAERNSVLRYLNYGILASIIAIGALVHSSGLNNEFTNYDDDKNVTQNEDIYDIGAKNVYQFFTKDYMGVYVPLTMLSYAVDNKLWGMNANKFHLTSLVIHLFNVCLVYFLILQMVPRMEVAAIAALLFAVHPINVEGIVWITSRSSLLYSLFYLGALISYTYYVQKDKKVYLLFSFLLFIFSALSKNAAVILPLTLVLMDAYYKRKMTIKSVAEKIPFFIVSLGIGILTLRIRKDAGMIDMPFTYSFIDRFFLACYSLTIYLFHVIIPYNFSAVYSYPFKSANLLPPLFYISPVFLLMIIYFLFKVKTFKRELLWGGAFFLVNLLLVLSTLLEDGFIANRYAYIPYIGLFFIIGFLYSGIKGNTIRVNEWVKTLLPFILTACVFLLSIVTFTRNEKWKDSITLWNDVLEKNPDCSFAYVGRANYKFLQKDLKGAIEDYTVALKLNPIYKPVYYFRSLAEYNNKDYKNAISDCSAAIRLDTNYALAYQQRGLILMEHIQDYSLAMRDFNKAISIKPTDMAYNNLGILNGMLKRYPEAIANLNKAIELNPKNDIALKNRGQAYFLSGNIVNACADYSRAAQLGNTEAAGLLRQHCRL